MKTQVIRSRRRKKTVDAQVVDGVLRVAIPASMSTEEELHWVELMRGRIERRLTCADVDLPARARTLASDMNLPRPSEIVFSDRQKQRWGSCSPADGRIRISSRIAGFPAWVLDYVIVHELAHFEEPNHSAAFWNLVNRYPLAERARGFLIAKEGETDS